MGLDGGKMQVLDKKGRIQKKFLVKSGLYKNPFYGNTEGDKPINTTNFAFDEKGQVFVAAYEWVSAYDLDAQPLEQVMKNNEEQAAAGKKDSSVIVQEKKVIIGGVSLKKK